MSRSVRHEAFAIIVPRAAIDFSPARGRRAALGQSANTADADLGHFSLFGSGFMREMFTLFGFFVCAECNADADVPLEIAASFGRLFSLPAVSAARPSRNASPIQTFRCNQQLVLFRLSFLTGPGPSDILLFSSVFHSNAE